MPDFEYLVTHHAKLLQQVMVSDLHLSPNEPALMQAFLDLLDALAILPNLSRLWILGDWFEAWLGDDVANTNLMQGWLTPMVTKLQRLSDSGCQIYVMHGNRDFLIGQKFCSQFGGTLIKEPFYLQLNGQKVRLEHGDALCTDDKQYQRFRRIIQNPFTKRLLLALPIKKREQIAHDLRQKSQADNVKKSLHIMDVNELAVKKALQHADILIHGHTHRPAEHDIDGKKRLVLGDWRIKDNVATVIGVALASDDAGFINQSIILCKFFAKHAA